MDHYIYVFLRGNGWHKIGMAVRPLNRMRQVGSKLQEKLSLVSQHAVPRSGTKRIEQRVHGLLVFCRQELEWFSCDLETADIAIAEAISDDLAGKPMPLKPPSSPQAKWSRDSQRRRMERARGDAEHARFVTALDTLCWSAGHLATILDIHRNTPGLWLRGVCRVPIPIVDWLADLAAYQAAHPPPKNCLPHGPGRPAGRR